MFKSQGEAVSDSLRVLPTVSFPNGMTLWLSSHLVRSIADHCVLNIPGTEQMRRPKVKGAQELLRPV